jgi:hypothetical protein
VGVRRGANRSIRLAGVAVGDTVMAGVGGTHGVTVTDGDGRGHTDWARALPR